MRRMRPSRNSGLDVDQRRRFVAALQVAVLQREIVPLLLAADARPEPDLV